jgi:hypothetical protein
MADFDRFRSFAERYVVERAGSFRTGFEQEDAFAAVLDAKGIYNNIAAQAKYMDQPEQAETTQSPLQGAGQQAAPNAFNPLSPRRGIRSPAGASGAIGTGKLPPHAIGTGNTAPVLKRRRRRGEIQFVQD